VETCDLHRDGMERRQFVQQTVFFGQAAIVDTASLARHRKWCKQGRPVVEPSFDRGRTRRGSHPSGPEKPPDPSMTAPGRLGEPGR
jgi:hypothetical protein